MIAVRYSVKVKVGCMEKALVLAKSVNEKAAPDYKGRIYTPAYGPLDVLIFEEVHESVAEREAYYEKYNGKPEFVAWWDRFNELIESGGSSEVWHVTEI